MISRLARKGTLEAVANERLTLGSGEQLLEYVESLYEEHYFRLYRFLLLQGCRPDDASDHVQEAFLRLLRFVKAGNKVERPKSWLIRVLHNLRIDESRRADHIGDSTVEEMEQHAYKAAAPTDVESELLDRERLAQVHGAMSLLTPQQAQYLLLRTEGLKLREIAELHGVTVQTVAEACARAVDRLGRLTHG